MQGLLAGISQAEAARLETKSTRDRVEELINIQINLQSKGRSAATIAFAEENNIPLTSPARSSIGGGLTIDPNAAAAASSSTPQRTPTIPTVFNSPVAGGVLPLSLQAWQQTCPQPPQSSPPPARSGAGGAAASGGGTPRCESAAAANAAMESAVADLESATTAFLQPATKLSGLRLVVEGPSQAGRYAVQVPSGIPPGGSFTAMVNGNSMRITVPMDVEVASDGSTTLVVEAGGGGGGRQQYVVDVPDGVPPGGSFLASVGGVRMRVTVPLTAGTAGATALPAQLLPEPRTYESSGGRRRGGRRRKTRSRYYEEDEDDADLEETEDSSSGVDMHAAPRRARVMSDDPPMSTETSVERALLAMLLQERKAEGAPSGGSAVEELSSRVLSRITAEEENRVEALNQWAELRRREDRVEVEASKELKRVRRMKREASAARRAIDRRVAYEKASIAAAAAGLPPPVEDVGGGPPPWPSSFAGAAVDSGLSSDDAAVAAAIAASMEPSGSAIAEPILSSSTSPVKAATPAKAAAITPKRQRIDAPAATEPALDASIGSSTKEAAAAESSGGGSPSLAAMIGRSPRFASANVFSAADLLDDVEDAIEESQRVPETALDDSADFDRTAVAERSTGSIEEKA